MFNRLFRGCSVCIFVIALVGCSSNQMKHQSTSIDVEEEQSPDAAQKTVESMLNKGLQEHLVAINEVIIINENEKLIKWRLSLGRRDYKLADFEIFENKAQKSVRLTKAGRYQISLESISQDQRAQVMKHDLVILVK